MRRTCALLVVPLWLAAGCAASQPPGSGTVVASPASAVTVSSAPSGAPALTSAATTEPTPAVTDPAAALAVFGGSWIGHTRQLTVSRGGAGHEEVSDGCCTPVVDYTFSLSEARPTGPSSAQATATVRSIKKYAADSGLPALQVGQRGTVTVSGGVLTDGLTGVTFCAPAQEDRGTCGA